MKIVFDKVGSTAKPFCEEKEGVKLEGTLQKTGHHRILLDAKLKGEIKMHCDRCGSEFDYALNNDLKLTLSDQVVEDKDDLDIIEFLDGVIDMEYIIESEMNAIESTYHYCSNCEHGEEDFEVEF
jgi:uncharacterized metal-binding protein YceD (DUF177 family)